MALAIYYFTRRASFLQSNLIKWKIIMIRHLLALVIFILLTITVHAETTAFNIAQTVIKMPISEGISIDEAIESMQLRANSLNVKQVAHQPMHKEFEALGLSDNFRIEIFQFCNAKIAKAMIEFDMNFAAYMPCRIVVMQDKADKGWLIMMNPELFINSAQLPPELKAEAEKIRDDLMSIIQAGANGEL